MNSNLHHTLDQPAEALIVDVQNLVHIYPNGTRALDGVSVQVREHEEMAIIGQNGSGKTTLVKHFNGLLQPSEGTVTVRGVDTRKTRSAELAKSVGYVFQNPNHQLFSVTVLDELKFGLKNLRLEKDEIERRVEDTIQLFQLKQYLQAHPYSLSMGVRKLVAISSIYAMNPDLIILDEPTTGQDYTSRKILSEAIAKIHSNGKSIIFVTHDMSFVAEHANRAVVMSRSKVVFDGTPKELFVRQEVLKEADLRPPFITQLSQRLTGQGLDPSVLTVPEMFDDVQRRLRL